MALSLLGFVGCGNSGPEVARVYGKVTYNGEPVTKGNISFSPVDPTTGSPASSVWRTLPVSVIPA